ncbi:MFS transporter [Geminisphaera colitermitum]|uniref:MFS transporter n=1 Tax=Geminisphaera colitermitum TaxID=1148786 RepID=UPI000158D0B6|nr:MFS transporter [Geminisphaera colitermitum]
MSNTRSPDASPRSVTRPEDRVSLREKIGIGCGRVAADGTAGTIHTLVNQVYNMTFGVNPALLSTAVFIQRLWDAILDPLFGQFSDNFRSPWGRRLPLLAAAAAPLALFFGLIWWFPTGLGSTGLFLFLVGTSLVFYTFHSLYAMPLNGLLIEATGDYHERTQVAMVAVVFALGFQIFGQWVFPLMQLSVFDSPTSGIRWVATSCAILFLGFALAPVFLCREKNYKHVAATQRKIPLREGLRHARRNPQLMRLIAARFISTFTYNIVGMFGIYMNTYYVFGGDLKAAAPVYGVLGSTYMISGALCSLLVYPALARRLGKKLTFQLAAGVLVLGCLSKLVVYHPGHPWLQLIVLAANGISGAGLTLMTTSMLGDIADYNEYLTGQRNEAFLAAVFAWFDKVGNSTGTLIGGFALLWIGFDATLGGQPQQTLQWMKYSYCFMPLIGAVVALCVMRTYTLDESRVAEIRRALDERHASPPPPPPFPK